MGYYYRVIYHRVCWACLSDNSVCIIFTRRVYRVRSIFSFSHFPWWFWVIEILFVALLFAADTISNLVGVKKFGGSKAGMWGSTIGLLIGPFVIPFAGIIAGPFIGAIIGELLVERKSINQAVKVGVGSVIGFLTSVVTKGIVQAVMIVLFFIAI